MKAIVRNGIIFCVFILLMQGMAAAEKYRVYFGSAAVQGDEGIFSSVLDLETGQLSEPKLVVQAMRPGVITIDPAGRHLYAIGKPAGYTGPRSGSVCAYRIDQKDGSLELLDFRESKGQGPDYLEVAHHGGSILVCHYRSGNCSVLPIAADGSLEPVSCVQQHQGSGQNPMRQASPHPHAIVLDSEDRYAFVPDLGIDRIMIYRFDSAAGKLIPAKPPSISTGAGTGPRHFVFHPSGHFAYANLELTSEVVVFEYDQERGSLREVQKISTLPDGFAGRNANAGIAATPDGSFLYVSNRGHSSIAMFAVDPKAGTLTPLGYESARGDVPQAITVDPTGTCLIVNDKRAGRVRVFRVSKKTGLLTYTGSTIRVPNVGAAVVYPRLLD